MCVSVCDYVYVSVCDYVYKCVWLCVWLCVIVCGKFLCDYSHEIKGKIEIK